MPVTTILQHGATSGVAPPVSRHQRALRGATGGWSDGATRRNTAFLRSVDCETLDGEGYACTLTVRDTPESPEEWHRLLNAFMLRLWREGMVRCHWVVEWQRRGVPHLHVALWYKRDGVSFHGVATAHWLELTKHLGTALRGQHEEPMQGFKGWAQYVSKHAARGAKHMQRSTASHPRGWKTSGRMWGKRGSWTTIEAVKETLTPKGFHMYRRVLKKLRIKDAQQKKDGRRITAARAMLKCHCPKLSAVRGTSEWIDIDTSLAIISWLLTQKQVVLGVNRAEKIVSRLAEPRNNSKQPIPLCQCKRCIEEREGTRNRVKPVAHVDDLWTTKNGSSQIEYSQSATYDHRRLIGADIHADNMNAADWEQFEAECIRSDTYEKLSNGI